jgi:hypothetical protein
MKVYITYCKDGYGYQEIDKIFSSSEKACKYTIERKFLSNDYYKDFSQDRLMKEALLFVEEGEVE